MSCISHVLKEEEEEREGVLEQSRCKPLFRAAGKVDNSEQRSLLLLL